MSVNAVAANGADHTSDGQQSISTREWDIYPDDISWGPLLGSGEYGAVYKGSWNGTPVAVKVLQRAGAVMVEKKLTAEIEVQRHTHHPNIIQFLGVCSTGSQVALVSELMDGGSLADALARRAQPPLRRVLEIALDCARGLNYLHLANPHAIVHRDLKPSNIMLGSCRSATSKKQGSGDVVVESAIAKIADFGLCRVISMLPHSASDTCIHRKSRLAPNDRTLATVSARGLPVCHPESVHPLSAENGLTQSPTGAPQAHGKRGPPAPGAAVTAEQLRGRSTAVRGSAPGVEQQYQMTGGTGSLAFMACEVFRHEPYNAKADVYSLAMVMYEMLAGRRPFSGMDCCVAAMHAATDDLRPDWPTQLPLMYTTAERAVWPDVKSLVERCWAGSPSLRPPCSDIITELQSLIARLDTHPGSPVHRQHSPRRVFESMRSVTNKTFSKLKGKA